ncbi:MAG: Tol-Pal system protein TolB [Rhodobacteraceae bacterium]|nr:MAG: Tol-Pal system protein TolB [Paracoccaceae bacterium]
MTPPMTRRHALAGAASLLAAPLLHRRALAQSPLEITVAGGEFRPIALALVPFFGPAPAGEATEVIRANLVNSGLFRAIDPAAFIQRPANIDEPPRYADWRAINAEALVLGDAETAADGRLRVRFRLYDVATGQQIEGLQFMVDPAAWRRAAHKVSDAVYSKLTGETGYFDSRIVFVDERGDKANRVKRLALMDQDGANLRYLTDGRELVLTPRFSPTDQEILYLSFATGEPQVFLLNLDTGQREALGRFPGMTFSPRFSPDGRSVALSLAQDGATDLYLLDLASRSLRRLTRTAAIDTAPSFSPDGRRLAFESDRAGGSQIYVMALGGGEGTAERISFGTGRYGTPVWSPRGDLIAFTRSQGGQFSVGVMQTDGSGERILDATFHSEGPSWAPNGRVLSFFRESPGDGGASSIWSVDITGMNLRRLPTPGPASDPAWSPLLP